MHSRSNATGFSNRSQDWKSNTSIITETETRIKHDIEMTDEEEIRVDIIELIDHHNIQKDEDIIDELDYQDQKIREAIQQLKHEGVLQVKNQ